MSQPLALSDLPMHNGYTVACAVQDTIEDLGLDHRPNPIIDLIKDSQTYYRFLGYATEVFLTDSTPDLSEKDVDTLAKIVKAGPRG